MPQPDFSHKCPVCLGDLASAPNGLACGLCGVSYPVRDGIPVLVSDFESHLGELDEAVRDNPTWYESSQLAWYDHGPCRHHLAQRRRYVESVLGDRAGRQGRAGSLLDLGCGDGANTRWLVEWADHVDACDYNLLRLRRCRRLVGDAVRFCLADVMHPPWSSGAFDVVFFNHVLEHIADDVGALRSVGRLLKSDGLLILGVPNAGCACMQLAYRLQPQLVAGSDHVQTYTAPLIAERARAAGFRVLHIEHIGWGVPHLRLDEKLRNYRRIDGLFAWIGRRFFARQATSLYVLLTRDPESG